MTTTRRFMCGLAAVAAALLAPPATAQTTAPPEGRLLASNCFQCHGTDGRSGFEEINGKSSTEIYSKLKEMQRKQPGTERLRHHGSARQGLHRRPVAEDLPVPFARSAEVTP